MKKVKLEPNEVELALNIASKRYIGNLKMGKTFSYGYTKGIKSQLTDGILGALGEVAYAKATNSFYNGSYSDDKQFYSDSDFQNNIEIRSQEKKSYNFLLIRPGEKKGKYILITPSSWFSEQKYSKPKKIFKLINHLLQLNNLIVPLTPSSLN